MRVATRSGELAWSHVYAFGHHSTTGTATMLHVSTANGRTLRLTGGHYLPVSASGCGAGALLEHSPIVAARTVQIGEGVWTLPWTHSDNNTAECSPVTSITRHTAVGYVSPWVLEGTIVVDGVVASMLSDLDNSAGIHPSSALHAALFSPRGSPTSLLRAALAAVFAPYHALFTCLRALRTHALPHSMRPAADDAIHAIMNAAVSLMAGSAIPQAGPTGRVVVALLPMALFALGAMAVLRSHRLRADYKKNKAAA